MAENIRFEDSDPRAVKRRQEAIIKECSRQAESCLYTSTSLYIWLRELRWTQRLFLAAPVVLGALAGVSAFQDQAPLVTALLAAAAGLFPSLMSALKMQTNVEEVAKLAAEFKALQDRFRRNETITTPHNVEVGAAVLAELMDRMDKARAASLTAPERCFKEAQKKINAGHYDFDADQTRRQKNSATS